MRLSPTSLGQDSDGRTVELSKTNSAQKSQPVLIHVLALHTGHIWVFFNNNNNKKKIGHDPDIINEHHHNNNHS